MVAHVLSLRARTFVLDGDIVIPVDGRLSFDDLLQRIHPAASRVERQSRERPAVRWWAGPGCPVTGAMV